MWSVGVLEKVILRWRLRRKGFRGLQITTDEAVEEQRQDTYVEEAYYISSRKQAEERVEKAVIRVQSMFRSKKAQQEYRRMKLAYDLATVCELVLKKSLFYTPVYQQNSFLSFRSWNMKALAALFRYDAQRT